MCDVSHILPDKAVLGQVFWLIILSSPIGLVMQLLFIAIEEAFEILLIARIGFQIEIFEEYLNQIYSNKDLAPFMLNIFIVLIVFYICNLLLLWYLYREAKKQGKVIVPTTLMHILQRYMAVFFTAVSTFLSIFVYSLQFISLYQVFQGTSYSQNRDAKTIQLVMIVILGLLSVTFMMVQESFYNLNFTNEILISAKPQSKRAKYLKLTQIVLLLSLSLQPKINSVNRILSLLALIFVSSINLFSFTQMPSYYNKKLSIVNFGIKVGKMAFELTLMLTALLGMDVSQFLLLSLLVFPIMLGLSALMRNYFRTQLISKILSDKLRTSQEVENALYFMLECMESKDMAENNSYMSIMMNYEETEQHSDSISYYDAIKQISDYKIQQAQMNNLGRLLGREEEQRMLDELAQEAIAAQMESMFITDVLMSEPNQMNEDSSLSPMGKSLVQNVMVTGGKGGGSAVAELSNSSLFEIFSNDQLSKKRMKEEKKHETVSIALDGIDIEITNLEEAIKKIKIQFLYNCLAKKACSKYPLNQAIMFFKAYISMNLLQNKHLTLTAITHIQTSIQKEGYLKQIESQVSQNYFLHIALSKQYQVNEEIDCTLMLEQSLQIDQILVYIKQCTEKIGIFWQIMAAQNVSRDQVEELLDISMDISSMLKKIKSYLVSMTSIDNFQSSCQSLYFYLCHFFTMVLRDSSQGSTILKHMLGMRSLGLQSQQKNSLIDEVGLAVVDGNFSLFGKIMFVNKTLVKLLGYKNEDFQEKRVHMLMPDKISEVHNKFWSLFAEQGIPKVLESTRFLYVKDKAGYIYPYKIFIKFMYHPEFGYCFTGVFRRPKIIVFDEQEPPVKVRKTFTLVCDQNGKILEISKSINQLTKLTPELVERLHNTLTENFTISALNPQLQIRNLDFSKNNTLFFRYINLAFGNIRQLAKTIEMTDSSEKEMFAGLRNTLKVQMKIIRETYGSQKSAIVTLYYVIFSEFNANQNTINNLGATQPQTFNPRFTQTSHSQFEEPHNEEDSENIYFNSKEDKAQVSSIAGGSMSTESLMAGGSGSMSSSLVSSQSNTDQSTEIKFIEEGIDYDRTPRPLLFLKIALLFLFIISIALSSVQFGLNRQWQQESIEYQKMLGNTVQCEERIQSLLLLVRSYLNINLKLEPNQSEFFNNRRGMIQEIGLNLIEQSRQNIKEVQQFLNFVENKKGHSVFSNSNVTIYDLYNNFTIESRELSRYFSINQWLVIVHDIFVTQDFYSNIQTFLKNNISVSSNDKAAFFFLINGDTQIMDKLDNFSKEVESFIVSEVDSTKQINTILIIITGIILVVLILSVVYFMMFFYSFKFKILIYFTELEKQTIAINELCALEFSQFLISDNYDVIRKNQKKLKDYENAKTENNIVGLIDNKKDKKSSNASMKTSKQSPDKVKSKHKSKKKTFKKNMFNENGILEEQKEEFKSEDEDDSKIDKIGEKFYSMSNNKRKGSALKDQQASKEIDLKQQLPSVSDVSRSDLKDLKFRHQVEITTNGEQVIHNKLIFARLKELKMKRISQLLVMGTGVSMFLIVYFIVQYLLFNKQQTDLSNNSHAISDLQLSLECTSDFLYNVRNQQTFNSSSYILASNRAQHLQTIKLDNQISSLNQTYLECIKQNQKVDSWLRTYSDGKFYFDGEEQNNVCTHMQSLGIFQNQSKLSLQNCTSIYQGILTKNGLSQVSLFLQDALYSAIRFETQKNKTEAFIRSELSSMQSLELLDSVSFYQQLGLRNFYRSVMEQIVNVGTNDTIVLALFIVFILTMVLLQTMINFLMLQRIRIQFWNAFYILKLLPKDDIKPEFIKRINEFLNKA